MPITEPLHLTTRESAEQLRLQSLDGTSAYLRRNGIIPLHRGRFLLWPRDEVLALVQKRSTKTGVRMVALPRSEVLARKQRRLAEAGNLKGVQP